MGVGVVLSLGVAGASMAADRPAPLPRVAEFEEAGFRLVPSQPGFAERRTAVFQRRDDFVMMDEDGDILPLPLPNSFYPRCRTVAGRDLFATWTEAGATRLARLDLDVPGDGWQTQAVTLIEFSLVGMDASGRGFVTGYTEPELIYQSEPGGTWRRRERIPFALPPEPQSRAVMNVEQARAPDDTRWIYNHAVETNAFRILSLVRFKDGGVQSTAYPTGAVANLVVPLGADRVLVSFLNRPPIVYDAEAMKPMGDPVFDGDPFEGPLVAWERGDDGAVWLLASTTLDGEAYSAQADTLWRWRAGEGLERLAEGIDDPQPSWIDPNVRINQHYRLRPSGSDTVFIATLLRGLVRWQAGSVERLDWRRGLRVRAPKDLWIGPDTLVVPDRNGFVRVPQDFSGLPAYVNPECKEYRTLDPLWRHASGELWTVLDAEPPQIAVWREGAWQAVLPVPDALADTHWLGPSGFGVDSVDRPWLFPAEGSNQSVWVAEQARPSGWLTYSNFTEALRTEVGRHADAYVPAHPYDRLHREPLRLPSGELWALESPEVLHVFRDGRWHRFTSESVGRRTKGERFSGPPVVNPYGFPRIRRGELLCAMHEGKVRAVQQWRAPFKTTLTLHEFMSRRRFGATMSSRVKTWHVYDGWGNQWRLEEAPPRIEVYPRRFNRSSRADQVHLAEASLWGSRLIEIPERSAQRFMVLDQQGGVFVCAACRGGRAIHWVHVPDVLPPRTFDVAVKVGDNQVQVDVEGLDAESTNGPAVKIRIAGGEWTWGDTLHPLREGPRDIEVRCVPRGDQVWTSETKRMSVEIPGDLDAALGRAAVELGHPEALRRRDAQRLLRDAGVEAVPLLLRLRQHPDPEVAERAREILRERREANR